MPFQKMCPEVVNRIVALAKSHERPQDIVDLTGRIEAETDLARKDVMRIELERLYADWIDSKVNVLPPDGENGILCRRRYRCVMRSCSFSSRS